MPRLAANITMLFREMTLLRRFEAAAAAGFDAVECLWPYELPPEQVRDALARHGLTMALINTPLGEADAMHFGLAAASGRRDAFVALFDRALGYAQSVGARAIHVMAGEWAIDDDNHAAIVANLREAGEKAADAGVTLVIEPINARDRPRWFLQSTAQALDILDAIDRPNVKLLFDLYHVQIIEGDLTRRLEACIDRVGHIQIAGVPERHEPDSGEVAVGRIFAALDRLNYAGWIGCEYNPRTTTEAGLGWAAPHGVVPRKGANR